MKELLRHQLGLLSWFLATQMSACKKQRVPLWLSIQKNVSLVDSVPQYFAIIVDVMALAQQIKLTQLTIFEEVADFIFKTAIKEASLSTRFDVVFDIFWDKSIKYTERLITAEGPKA